MTKRQLVEGVHIHHIPSSKFKTVQLVVHFKMPLDRDAMTAHSLLSQLLVTNTEKYPTQTLFRKKLAELYGTRITSDVSRKGECSIFSIHLSLVNDVFLAEENLYEQVVEFLNEVIFHPHIESGQFHEATFAREKENLKELLLAAADDKMRYAQDQLKELHFDEPAQKLSLRGNIEDLEKLTSESLVKTYEQLLNDSEVDILVVGDLEGERALQPLEKLPFTPRSVEDSSLVYTQEVHEELRYKEEVQNIFQAKLNMAFSAPIVPYSQEFYALQVFNGIFGGFPHSKLFMEVREKQSLAYYASSNFDVFRQTLFVQTGIESANAEKVQELVLEQLKAIQSGDFSKQQLQQTKEMMAQLIQQLSDYPGTILARRYEEILTGGDLSSKHWVDQIKKVTFAEVQEIAKQITPQAVFLLKGEEV